MHYAVPQHYPAVYRDREGIEETTLINDGDELTLTVRGVTFLSRWLDDFEPTLGTDSDALASFTLHHGTNFTALCGYELEFVLPAPLLREEDVEEVCLQVLIRLGVPDERGGLDEATLRLTLTVGEQTFQSRGTSGWFEDELLDLQAALPSGASLRTCIACAYSDYSPYGHGFFGGLYCFRDCKAEYLAVETKADLFRIWDENSGQVQETYHCPEWARRRPGTGYRG